MKIIIAGAGAVGTHLAELLSKENHDIILMDENPEKMESLANGNYDLLTMGVSPTSIAAQKEAGVAHADLFIAVTPHEACNITCCMLAHTLGAKKTVARVDNSEYTSKENVAMFNRMGIDSLIYPEELAAQEIIDGEDRKKPLSDEGIRKELEKLDVQISRRTVNKYRQELGLPDKQGRKEW